MKNHHLLLIAIISLANTQTLVLTMDCGKPQPLSTEQNQKSPVAQLTQQKYTLMTKNVPTTSIEIQKKSPLDHIEEMFFNPFLQLFKPAATANTLDEKSFTKNRAALIQLTQSLTAQTLEYDKTLPVLLETLKNINNAAEKKTYKKKTLLSIKESVAKISVIIQLALDSVPKLKHTDLSSLSLREQPIKIIEITTKNTDYITLQKLCHIITERIIFLENNSRSLQKQFFWSLIGITFVVQWLASLLS